jgi:ACS family hexuronate transporter-like MFS transporter
VTRPIRHLRWYIGGLLFLSTVINYIDRQTLSVLGPYLKTEYRWTNSDFALVLIAFRLAYAIGQTIAGRTIDRLNSDRPEPVRSVSRWPGDVSRWQQVCRIRFALGLGEAATGPGRRRSPMVWRESGGAVVCSTADRPSAAHWRWIVLTIYHVFGSWRPAFLLRHPGAPLADPVSRGSPAPEDHPRLSPGAKVSSPIDQQRHPGIPTNVRCPTTPPCGCLKPGAAIQDVHGPCLFFITDWFTIIP